jgi:hypothetical protein
LLQPIPRIMAKSSTDMSVPVLECLWDYASGFQTNSLHRPPILTDRPSTTPRKRIRACLPHSLSLHSILSSGHEAIIQRPVSHPPQQPASRRLDVLGNNWIRCLERSKETILALDYRLCKGLYDRGLGWQAQRRRRHKPWGNSSPLFAHRLPSPLQPPSRRAVSHKVAK